ncbi:MAG: 50S ribosomal protein L25 [Candidatus Paceibacterota bacterium]
MLKLKVEKRDLKESLDSLRSAFKLPAVYYGKKEASTPIKLNLIDFKRALKTAGESTIISLDGAGIDVDVLIHDVDLDPVTDVPIHVDFYAIEKDKKLSVGVPLEFVGVSPAVKDLGAVLVKVAHEIEIEALPKDLPGKLEADISALVNFDSVITAADIKLPSGVSLKGKPEEVIASVYEPKEEVIETAPVDLSSIEVEKKGKETKEGAEGEAAPATETKEKEEKKDKK